MNTKKKLPVIVDTTLRDGLQMPGVQIDLERKLEVLERLAMLGITEAEIGCPGQGTKTVRELATLCRKFPFINCSAWCRARREDIDHAIDSGVTTVHVSFPVSERHMQIIGFTRKDVLGRLETLVANVTMQTCFVTVGAQDAMRADKAFLREFVTLAGAVGARRVRIADTVGTAIPESVAFLIGFLHENCPGIGLEYHGHNDFGLAVAGTLSAIETGVEAVSVTVSGVGERAGNAALEEVVSAAVMLYGYETTLHLTELAGLCQAVRNAWNIPEFLPKAISGSNAFRHESGIHCHGMLRDALAYQPCIPDELGFQSSYSIGAQSGYSSVQAVMNSKGMTIDREQSQEIWEHHLERQRLHRTWIDGHEIA
jgi:homocitrate synthase NifV